ncbi:MAG: hypothetical protein JWM11_6279 [Planctomycetaceae bacterium]|nr:hypothetical protein [Planctomycetaceae bacterium]
MSEERPVTVESEDYRKSNHDLCDAQVEIARVLAQSLAKLWTNTAKHSVPEVIVRRNLGQTGQTL